MRPLHPPIELIEAGLFGAAEPAGEAEPEPHSPPPAAEWADPLVPAYLRAAFGQRAAALQLPSQAPLERGQVRLVACVLDGSGGERRRLAQPIAALLRMQVEGALWRAWLVSPEADYASDRDVVLGERDAPVDPLAAMVQTGAELRLAIAPAARLLAVLTSERMHAIEAVAAEPQGAAGEISPGRVVLRDTAGGDSVATGTPLPATGDPRMAYQALYRRLAAELELATARAPAAANAAEPASPGRALREWLERNFGWRGAFATATVVLLAQSVLLSGALDSGRPAEDGYRGPPSPFGRPTARTVPAVRVVFSPDVPQARVQRAVRDIGGTIVSGPDEFGEFVVVVNQVAPAEAIARMRLAGVVDSAQELKGGWPWPSR